MEKFYEDLRVTLFCPLCLLLATVIMMLENHDQVFENCLGGGNGKMSPSILSRKLQKLTLKINFHIFSMKKKAKD